MPRSLAVRILQIFSHPPKGFGSLWSSQAKQAQQLVNGNHETTDDKIPINFFFGLNGIVALI